MRGALFTLVRCLKTGQCTHNTLSVSNADRAVTWRTIWGNDPRPKNDTQFAFYGARETMEIYKITRDIVRRHRTIVCTCIIWCVGCETDFHSADMYGAVRPLLLLAVWIMRPIITRRVQIVRHCVCAGARSFYFTKEQYKNVTSRFVLSQGACSAQVWSQHPLCFSFPISLIRGVRAHSANCWYLGVHNK